MCVSLFPEGPILGASVAFSYPHIRAPPKTQAILVLKVHLIVKHKHTHGPILLPGYTYFNYYLFISTNICRVVVVICILKELLAANTLILPSSVGLFTKQDVAVLIVLKVCYLCQCKLTC